eukprot:scaffold6934_cov121-Isochrysis_galbana.AAC.12
MAGLGDVACLEGHLQAAAAHPEGHRVHVHLLHLIGLLQGGGRGAAFGPLRFAGPDILESRDADVYLGAAAPLDVGHQRSKPGRWVDDLVRDEERVGEAGLECVGWDGEVAHTHHWEARHRRADLIWLEGGQDARAADAHVALHLHQVGRVARVGPRGRALKHPRAPLRNPAAVLSQGFGVCLLVLQRLEYLRAAER